jgi:hypothetical protein
MLEGGTTNELSKISDASLIARLENLVIDLAISDTKMLTTCTARSRSRRMFRGVALTVVGTLLAAPTGGLALLLCVTGIADLIDVLEEDAAAVKLQTELRNDLERYDRAFKRIASEHTRRA